MNVTENLEPLPCDVEFATAEVLGQLVGAQARLAELRGLVALLRVEDLFLVAPRLAPLNELLLRQEALASLSIEGERSTYERLLQSQLLGASGLSKSELSLHRYMKAYRLGASNLQKEGNWLTNEHLWDIHAALLDKVSDYREGAGALVKNLQNAEIVYKPPQDGAVIRSLMDNLLVFMKDDQLSHHDPLIKLAMIHGQFERIRPFMSHNGRMGRLLSILYLQQKNLLDVPILVMSHTVSQNKMTYYNLLRQPPSKETWIAWVVFMLRMIEESARQTSVTIWRIIILMRRTHKALLARLPKLYGLPNRTGLLHNMFDNPYTTIELVMRDMDVSRLTAARYLRHLVDGGFLQIQRHGRNNFFLNRALLDILQYKA